MAEETASSNLVPFDSIAQFPALAHDARAQNYSRGYHMKQGKENNADEVIVDLMIKTGLGEAT